MITSMTRHVHSFPWLKFGHEAYLFSEFRANASAIAKAAFLDLICYSTKQTPSFSIPANDKTLAGWVQISLNQWLKVKDLVLSQFTLGDDGRYHCNMLADLYSDYDADKEQQDEDTSTPKEPKTRSTSAERMQRKRERDEAEALARQASQNKSSDAHVTPENVTCDASVTACDGVCDTQSVTCDADVTQGSVTCDAENVTNGGKGEDSDLEKKLDLDSVKTSEDKSSGSVPQKQSSIASLVEQIPPPPDAFTTTSRQVLWTVGVPLLVEHGSKADTARKFLGQMVKIYGEESVADAVTEARISKPMSATEYIGGYLKNQAKQKIKKDTNERKSSLIPDNNSRAWMTPEMEAQLNAQFAA